MGLMKTAVSYTFVEPSSPASPSTHLHPVCPPYPWQELLQTLPPGCHGAGIVVVPEASAPGGGFSPF